MYAKILTVPKTSSISLLLTKKNLQYTFVLIFLRYLESMNENNTIGQTTTAFERIYNHMVFGNPLTMSECIKQNYDLAVRFLLARNNAPHVLVEFLFKSMKKTRNNISKAIA